MNKPLVAIIGTTGSGKSKLALHLASVLNGELVNADSMQIYQGLPIVTNQPSSLEISSVPHHLLAFLHVHQEYAVPDYQRDVLHAVFFFCSSSRSTTFMPEISFPSSSVEHTTTSNPSSGTINFWLQMNIPWRFRTLRYQRRNSNCFERF